MRPNYYIYHSSSYLERAFIFNCPDTYTNRYNRHKHQWYEDEDPWVLLFLYTPWFQVVTCQDLKH